MRSAAAQAVSEYAESLRNGTRKLPKGSQFFVLRKALELIKSDPTNASEIATVALAYQER